MEVLHGGTVFQFSKSGAHEGDVHLPELPAPNPWLTRGAGGAGGDGGGGGDGGKAIRVSSQETGCLFAPVVRRHMIGMLSESESESESEATTSVMVRSRWCCSSVKLVASKSARYDQQFDTIDPINPERKVSVCPREALRQALWSTPPRCSTGRPEV